MKSISRRFSAYTEEASRGKRNLRLLTTPLDRFAEDNGKESDGALFSLVVGNDCEVILALETRESTPDVHVWQYGLVRSTLSTSVVLLDEIEVWRHDAAEQSSTEMTATYLSIHGVATLPLEAPKSSSR